MIYKFLTKIIHLHTTIAMQSRLQSGIPCNRRLIKMAAGISLQASFTECDSSGLKGYVKSFDQLEALIKRQ